MDGEGGHEDDEVVDGQIDDTSTEGEVRIAHECRRCGRRTPAMWILISSWYGLDRSCWVACTLVETTPLGVNGTSNREHEHASISNVNICALISNTSHTTGKNRF